MIGIISLNGPPRRPDAAARAGSRTSRRSGSSRARPGSPGHLDVRRGGGRRRRLAPPEMLLGPFPGLTDAGLHECPPDRQQKDPGVEPERRVVHVPDVEREPMLPRQGVTAVELSPPRDPGPHLVPAGPLPPGAAPGPPPAAPGGAAFPPPPLGRPLAPRRSPRRAPPRAGEGRVRRSRPPGLPPSPAGTSEALRRAAA